MTRARAMWIRVIALALTACGGDAHAPKNLGGERSASGTAIAIASAAPSAPTTAPLEPVGSPPWVVDARAEGITDLSIDEQGNIVSAGETWERATHGYRLNVTSREPNGKVRWSTSWSGFRAAPIPEFDFDPFHGQAHVAVDASGSAIAVASAFVGQVDFAGKPAARPKAFRDGLHVAALDASGKVRWAGRFEADLLECDGLATIADGSTFLLGEFGGKLVFTPAAGGASMPVLERGAFSEFLLRFGPDGRLSWAHIIGSGNLDVALGTSPDHIVVASWPGQPPVLYEAGNVFDAGGGPFVSDFVARFSNDGTFLDAEMLDRDPDNKGSWDALERFARTEHVHFEEITWDIRGDSAVQNGRDVVVTRHGKTWVTSELETSALAFDPIGNLVIATPTAVVKLSRSGEISDCEPLDGCVFAGRCTLDRGTCVLAKTADCKRTNECKDSGACTFVSGKCAVDTDADCLASKDCKETGKCAKGAGAECVLTDAGCHASHECKTVGACSLVGELCRPTTDADCQNSESCPGSGACRLDTKDAAAPKCVPRSAADCTKSTACQDEGSCTFTGDGCSLYAFDACDEKSIEKCYDRAIANCARSHVCTQGGRCTFSIAMGCAATPSGCLQSTNCKESGACGVVEGREDLGCIVDDDGCAKSAICASEGLCTSKYLGGSDFPRYECRAMYDRDCQRSAACKKEKRCRSDGDACVL